MRLKHRPWADTFLREHGDLIKDRDTIGDEAFLRFVDCPSLQLEIGVGRGDFILQMAAAHPEVHYLGVEVSGMAIAIAGKKIVQQELSNLMLVRMDVHDLFQKTEEGAFDAIYLNFSDPWPKKRQHKRRLTYPTCLKEYFRMLKNGGILCFKTDNEALFEDSIGYFEASSFTIESLTRDYAVPEPGDPMSEYERKFRQSGTPIRRLVARKGERTL